MALLGLSALLLAGVNVVWGSEAKLLPPPSATLFEYGDLQIARSDVVTLLIAAAVGGLLTLFLRRTRLGLALRAQGNDTEGRPPGRRRPGHAQPCRLGCCRRCSGRWP